MALKSTHSTLREPRTSNGLELLISNLSFPISTKSHSVYNLAELNKRKELKEFQLQIIPNKVVYPPCYSSVAADKSKTRTVCCWPSYSLVTQKVIFPSLFVYVKDVKHLVYCHFLMLSEIHCDTSKMFTE